MQKTVTWRLEKKKNPHRECGEGLLERGKEQLLLPAERPAGEAGVHGARRVVGGDVPLGGDPDAVTGLVGGVLDHRELPGAQAAAREHGAVVSPSAGRGELAAVRLRQDEAVDGGLRGDRRGGVGRRVGGRRSPLGVLHAHRDQPGEERRDEDPDEDDADRLPDRPLVRGRDRADAVVVPGRRAGIVGLDHPGGGPEAATARNRSAGVQVRTRRGVGQRPEGGRGRGRIVDRRSEGLEALTVWRAIHLGRLRDRGRRGRNGGGPSGRRGRGPRERDDRGRGNDGCRDDGRNRHGFLDEDDLRCGRGRLLGGRRDGGGTCLGEQLAHVARGARRRRDLVGGPGVTRRSSD